MSDPDIRIGTAGWSIPARHAAHFPDEGSGLARYATRFKAAEINSSFYRCHKPETYSRWAAAVPDGFRFAVKVPKAITHERRLADSAEPLDWFLAEIAGLGAALGPLLVQLPPSLAFDAAVAGAFFDALRARYDGLVACEPRHVSWFDSDADALLIHNRVARVGADPARAPDAAVPGGWPGLAYWRLHGSPRMYFSEYGAEFLGDLAKRLAAAAVEAWCMFDNTASGAALGDALTLQNLVCSARRREQA
jgi:uncharacterized protein YecE (DUF72 family)